MIRKGHFQPANRQRVGDTYPATMSSKRHSDPLDFQRDIPTTREDIVAQEAARQIPRMSLRECLERLSRAPYPFPLPPRLTTFEGCPPFER
jgi:hypothetical protein